MTDRSVIHAVLVNAKKQIEDHQRNIEQIAEHAKKKPGLFQRLASVGLGRKDDPVAANQREPSIPMQSAPRQQMQARPQPQVMQPQENQLDDDQLEIPAFLRRQAN